jgi:hypothetical protein
VRRTSNGIEHGSAGFVEIWSVPFVSYQKVAGYVREAIFNLVDLPNETRQVLESVYVDVYVSPDPPLRQGYNTAPPPRPYEIPPRPQYDYYALDFNPQPVAVSMDYVKCEFVVDYGEIPA